MTVHVNRVWLLPVALAASALACGRTEPGSAATQPFTPVATVRELMEEVVDPSAQVLFQSVAVISDASGVTEHQPRTDEEWAHVGRHALLLAESANLLKIPRPVAGSNTVEGTAAGSPELTPAQIEERLASDRAAWDRHADALLEAANRALTAARSRDVQGLFDVGGDVYAACESCHLTFWYPDARGFRPALPP